MIKVELISATRDSEEIIERAFRTCFRSKMSESYGERKKFIQRCIARGHLSCLEFAQATFLIECSRVATHQLVRHRIASFAQESQRRVEVDLEEIFIPPLIENSPQAREIFLNAAREAKEAYKKLLTLGIKKEDARYILPQAVKSRILVSMNFRAWRHFLKLRCDAASQWEIREIAKKILEILFDIAPSVFEDLYEKFILETRKELLTERD